jgi:hypothetical protein
MPSSHSPDRLAVAFDDDHAVANAGLLLPATLADRLGIEAVTDELVNLSDRPGHHRPGRKVLTLLHALMAGGDCISDADVLRTGSTASVLGHQVMAPSTLGPSCARSPSGTSASSTASPRPSGCRSTGSISRWTGLRGSGQGDLEPVTGVCRAGTAAGQPVLVDGQRHAEGEAMAGAAFMAHPVWETVLPCHRGPPVPDHRPVGGPSG